MTAKSIFIPFLALFAALAFVGARQTDAASRQLMATASDEAVALARVQPPDKTDPDASTEQSIVLLRMLGTRETRWRKLATLSGRVVSIAACDEDAKVLLDTGDWLTVWPDGQAFGPPAPGVRLIALAADHDVLWAVGVPAPLIASATTQATAVATTAESAKRAEPATQPEAWPRTPAVYRFDGAQWLRVMALPAEVQSTDPAHLSLAILEHQPVLASDDGSSGIRVWTADGGHWSTPRQWSASRPVLDFNILNAGLPATLWFTDGGPGVLTNVAGDHPLGPDGSAESDPRSAARAAEAIRVFSASGDHIYEQDYGSDGTAMDKPAELVIETPGGDSQVENWLAPTLTVVVTMLLFGAARRGGLAEAPPSLAELNLSLAPLFPRFIAGTIDALPVLISILYVARELAIAGATDDMPTNAQMIPFYVGSAIYLLYVIGAELLLGTTLGKWLFGLKIVSLDGTRPPRAALLVRNLLRLVDLMLMWLPLAMVLFSPLRQRVGDLAAGTLVVRTTPAVKPEETPS